MDNQTLVRTFDQSILRPENVFESEIKRICADAIKYSYRGVVVHPCNIPLIKNLLEGSKVLSVSVCDFPHGRGLTKVRSKDIKEILKLGVDEIDIVANYQYLLEDDYRNFKKDLKSCAKEIEDKVLKIILEVDYLNEKLIRTATEAICKVQQEENKKIIVKTKTGFAENKIPNIDAVRIIRKTLEEEKLYGTIQIKASGGIRTKDEAIKLIEAGAHVLGVGNGVGIIN